MTSTPHVWTQKWTSRQNQLISTCLVMDFDTFLSATGGQYSGGAAHRFSALWDTGATHTVISHNVVDTLRLQQEGFVPIIHANGEDVAPIYHIFLTLPNGIGFPMVNVAATRLTGFDILIGMDIINRGDFAISNRNDKTMFSFRFPSMTDFDFQSELESSGNDAQ